MNYLELIFISLYAYVVLYPCALEDEAALQSIHESFEYLSFVYLDAVESLHRFVSVVRQSVEEASFYQL